MVTGDEAAGTPLAQPAALDENHVAEGAAGADASPAPPPYEVAPVDAGAESRAEVNIPAPAAGAKRKRDLLEEVTIEVLFNCKRLSEPDMSIRGAGIEDENTLDSTACTSISQAPSTTPRSRDAGCRAA